MWAGAKADYTSSKGKPTVSAAANMQLSNWTDHHHIKRILITIRYWEEIIIVLILVALVVFGLHYKRKLPESFYNLGGLVKGDKQWKPVLSKV